MRTMKKMYQKPTLTKGPLLATVTAVVCVSPNQINCTPA
jgi:hypothetical protein